MPRPFNIPSAGPTRANDSMILIFAMLLTCFWAPGLVDYREDRFTGLRRFMTGVAAVAVVLFISVEAMVVLGLTVRIPIGVFSNFLFLWISTAVYWVPFLLVRVVQLGLRDRKRNAVGTT